MSALNPGRLPQTPAEGLLCAGRVSLPYFTEQLSVVEMSVSVSPSPRLPVQLGELKAQREARPGEPRVMLGPVLSLYCPHEVNTTLYRNSRHLTFLK